MFRRRNFIQYNTLFVPARVGMMPGGTDYNIGSDPALWPPQGPMQGMAGGSGAPYPMNPGTPYNQGSLDVGGYPGNQPQSTPMSMRMYRCLVYKFMCTPNSLF